VSEKLVEERAGEGMLTVRGKPVGPVAYAIHRYQAMTAGGLPVPGLHRIVGRIAIESLGGIAGLEQNARVGLELEDGRRLELTFVDANGRVLAEGHGPGQCGCC
jgi:hypothetical protein